MIHFTCPDCRKHLKAENEWVDRRIRCPKCGSAFPVPRSQGPIVPFSLSETPLAMPDEPSGGPLVPAETYSSPEPVADYSDYSSEWEDQRRSQRTTGLLIAVGLSSILLLGFVVIAALKSEPAKPTGKAVAKGAGQQQRPEQREEPAIRARPQEQPVERPTHVGPGQVPEQPDQGDSLLLPILDKFMQEQRARQQTSPRRQPEPTNMALEQETPVPGKLLKEIVIGYETRLINGFTMLLSTQAVREAKKDNGRPFQALQAEFDGLVKVLPATALKPLRRVLIWIEWDNMDRSNPNVLAKYYGGRIWRLDGKEHPLKSNAVEVLSLKNLAMQKNSSVGETHLTLLHEIAHAVHHVFLVDGFENVNVVFAYNQAMDRRLYDRVQTARGGVAKAYAATNPAEYFAELTCAYLDRCDSYPFTREELKEYDPTGYRMMEMVWGKGTPAGAIGR